MNRSVDEAVHEIAATQHGCVHSAQIAAAGGDRALIRRRVRAGRWTRLHPDVVHLPGRPVSWTTAIWAAHLQFGAESVVSHESAAELHGIEGTLRGVLSLIVPRPHRHESAKVRIHRLTDLRPDHVVRKDGLPVTTPARTILDLAGQLSRPRLLHVVQCAVIDRHTTLPTIGATLARVRRRGKPGVRHLEEVLDHLGGEPQSHGRLEALLDRLIATIPGAVALPEQLIVGRRSVVGLVDRLFPVERLIVEADGRRWHSRVQRLANDARRDKEAAAVGYQTARFTWEELTSDLDGSRRLLVDILEERRQGLKPPNSG